MRKAAVIIRGGIVFTIVRGRPDLPIDPHELASAPMAGYDLHRPDRHLVVRGQNLAHLLVGLPFLGRRGNVNFQGPVSQFAADLIFSAAGNHFYSESHFSR